jgi:hypothetical protein
MKKISILLGLGFILFASWILFSFRTEDSDKVEVTITSTKPLNFDLHMYKEAKTLRALTTPYTFSVDNDMAQYIFKSSKPESELKMEVKRNGKTTLTASWSLIVLTRNHKELSTFGLNLNE